MAFFLHVRPYQRPAGVQEYEKERGWIAVQVPLGTGIFLRLAFLLRPKDCSKSFSFRIGDWLYYKADILCALAILIKCMEWPVEPSTFLHLSDIHFRRNANTPYDAFKDLRDELERDASEMAKRLKGAHGILISGDVAFSGQTDEYKIAQAWLKRICEKLNCPQENVWMIPGNHDVDRKVVEKSISIEDAHKNLRESAGELDHKLARYLGSDPEAAKLIYRPIEKYIDFAAKYGCEISPEKPYWEEDWPLNDGSTLRIRGLNSTIVSDESDNDASNKLVVGKRQLEMTRQDGVEYLAMCHHPPTWLLDHDSAEDLLCSRARLHLFGHKHRQRVVPIEQSVRVTAGAMHPDEREPNWQPRYNFLQISIEADTQGKRHMKVVVYPRVYKEESTKFVADFDEEGHDYREYNCPLPDWKSPVTQSQPASPKVSAAEGSAVSSARGSKMRPGRKLTYKFMDLPHHTKLKIAQNLGLIRDEDEGLRDAELYKRYFDRAAELNKLAELWDLVQNEYGDTDKDNPYKRSSGAA